MTQPTLADAITAMFQRPAAAPQDVCWLVNQEFSRRLAEFAAKHTWWSLYRAARRAGNRDRATAAIGRKRSGFIKLVLTYLTHT